MKRFYREVEAAAKLKHPNIVTAHDAGEHEGVHYLVMEYVEGKDLAAIVKERGPMSVPPPWSASSRPPAGCTMPTARGSSTATSSPATC